MTTAIARAEVHADLMEQVVVGGDLASLTPQQRVSYYMRVCESLGLNPLTKPFDYIRLNGKLTLYTRKDATDQLRKLNSVSITRVERELVNEVYVVTVYAATRDGREDSDVGAVSVKGLAGEALANAYMKAMTKAKRRVTLSICGLGMLDETEVETISDAQPVTVDTATGEIVAASTPLDPEAAQAAANKARFARLAAAARARNIAAPHLDKTMTPSQVADVLTAWEDAINAA